MLRKQDFDNSSGFGLTIIVVAIVILLVIGLVIFKNKTSSQNSPPTANITYQNSDLITQATDQPKPEIATDPSFPEVKGQLLLGFPTDFPVYQEATLEGSAKTNTEAQSDTGYRAIWVVSQSNTPLIMQWYQAELPKKGWEVEPTNDPEAGEQIMNISKGKYKGFMEVVTKKDGETEIEVEVRIN